MITGVDMKNDEIDMHHNLPCPVIKRDDITDDDKRMAAKDDEIKELVASVTQLQDMLVDGHNELITQDERIAELEKLVTGDTSDGYHTFNELYEFRKMYNAALFNEWATQDKYQVHKSLRHYEGEECFGGGHFIVVAILPTGQISNHYKIEDWDLFEVPSHEKVLFPYDGHTGVDVLQRLRSIQEGS